MATLTVDDLGIDQVARSVVGYAGMEADPTFAHAVLRFDVNDMVWEGDLFDSLMGACCLAQVKRDRIAMSFIFLGGACCFCVGVSRNCSLTLPHSGVGLLRVLSLTCSLTTSLSRTFALCSVLV
jgi:hypothetical protein